MTGAEFKSLQIGMYVTDVDSLVKSDYCQVQGFTRMGQIKLQPHGQPENKAFWIYYKDYDLKDKMFASEFKELTL